MAAGVQREIHGQGGVWRGSASTLDPNWPGRTGRSELMDPARKHEEKDDPDPGDVNDKKPEVSG